MPAGEWLACGGLRWGHGGAWLTKISPKHPDSIPMSRVKNDYGGRIKKRRHQKNVEPEVHAKYVKPGSELEGAAFKAQKTYGTNEVELKDLMKQAGLKNIDKYDDIGEYVKQIRKNLEKVPDGPRLPGDDESALRYIQHAAINQAFAKKGVDLDDALLYNNSGGGPLAGSKELRDTYGYAAWGDIVRASAPQGRFRNAWDKVRKAVSLEEIVLEEIHKVLENYQKS